MAASYEVMTRRYHRIFDRCGLDYAVVEAEAGQIGGGINHEFMARAEVGEDLFVECEHGDYIADLKAARPMAPEPAGRSHPGAHRRRHARHADDRDAGRAPRTSTPRRR